MAPSAAITVRRVPFEFPPGLDPVVVPGCPEESFLSVGLSLILPYVEPYLIHSMRAAKDRITDPQLLADLEAFNAQEGQHYRQHMRFNDAVRLGGYPGLAAIEADIEADYKRFSETRSLRFNLAYAEGFEAMTSALARFTFQTGLFARLTSPARDLFEWHLIEELEHRNVAFDVYDQIFGGYFYRLFVGLYAQWHLNRFIFRASKVLQTADPAAFRARFGGAARAWKRVLPLLALNLRHFVPKVVASWLPWYTPHRIAMPAGAQALADHYAELSKPPIRPG